MDFYLQKLLWNPFKWVGHQFGRIKGKWTIALFTLLFLSGVIGYVFPNFLDSSILNIMPVSLASLGLVLILQAFSERGDVLIAWFSIAAAQLFFSLSIALHSPNFDMIQILIFSGGSLLSAIVGFFCLIKIKSIESTISLGQFHGYIYEYPKTGFFFLVACLGIIGLPFTPTFIGIDLLFSHIGKNQVPMIVIMTVSYLLLELSILRIYSRIFLGIHKKAYHAIVFRSS